MLRSRGALLFSLLVGSPAWAAPKGSAFSGPNHLDGATIYYCPAAMAETSGWSAMAEVQLAVLSASFQRAGANPHNDNQPYRDAAFTTAAPDLSFTISAPTPLDWLRVVSGGFSPILAGGRWPEDGAQRYSATNATLASYALFLGPLIKPHPRIGVALLGGVGYALLQLDASQDYGSVANELAGADLFLPEDPRFEGRARISTTGWFGNVLASVWAKPMDALRLALAFDWHQTLPLDGTLEAEGPPALSEVLPGYVLNPRGKVKVWYPAPWRLKGEAELTLGGTRAAVFGQFVGNKGLRNYQLEIYEAEPDVLEARGVQVTNGNNDFQLGVRVSHAFTPTWEVGGRLDYDARSVPDEGTTANSVEFHQVEIGQKVLFRPSAGLGLSLSYTFVYTVPIVVQNSLFNWRNPKSSGLQGSPMNGRFEAMAHKISVGVIGTWGAP